MTAATATPVNLSYGPPAEFADPIPPADGDQGAPFIATDSDPVSLLNADPAGFYGELLNAVNRRLRQPAQQRCAERRERFLTLRTYVLQRAFRPVTGFVRPVSYRAVAYGWRTAR